MRRAFAILALTAGCSGSSAEAPPAGARVQPARIVAAAPAPSPLPPAPPAPPEHAVFSLADNRALAHVQRDGGLVLVAGGAGFAKYAHLGRPRFKLHQRIDGKQVAILQQKEALLELPMSAAQAAAAEAVTLRVHAARKGELRLEVNGRRAGKLPIVPGWQTVRLRLPAGRFAAGENRLGLRFERRALAVEWIQVGGAPPPGDDAPRPWDPATHTLVLPEGGGLAWYVQLPEQGRLVGEVRGEGCAIEVSATGRDAAASGVLAGERATVDLAAVAGKVVRLELVARGCAEARLAGAALVVPGAAPVVTRPARPKHVVLWIMDTLRADHVRPFGEGARADVPTWEWLSRTGTVFLHHYAGGCESQASHATLFTSMFPVNHQIIPTSGHPWRFERGWTTLGEVMDGAGYFGAAITANGFVPAEAGYGAGFDSYTNLMRRDGRFTRGYVPGQKVYDTMLQAIDGHTSDPFFLFIGTVDTHMPLQAHEPWTSRYHPERYRGKFEKKVTAGGIGVTFAVSRTRPSERDYRRLLAIYDANVSYQDALVGRFFAQLDAWGIAHDTMVIVTADHGEEHFEAGIGGHGGSIRDSLVHVPLAIWYPPLFPPGLVVEGTDHTDLLPTIQDAIGAPPSDDWQGESLIPLAQGFGRGYPRPAITTQYEYAHAMRLGDYKLRVGSRGVILYDLAADPGETRNVAAARPIELRFVRDALSTWMVYRRAWKKSRWGVASNLTERGAEELDAL